MYSANFVLILGKCRAREAGDSIKPSPLGLGEAVTQNTRARETGDRCVTSYLSPVSRALKKSSQFLPRSDERGFTLTPVSRARNDG
jgi:hypothetical protein